MQAFKESVLLVDDEPQMLVALEDLLGDDFKIFKTESAEQALEMALHDDAIAVVISDQRMPKMAGDELLTRLSASSDARRILVTAFADLAAVIRAVNNGKIFAYVTKPWNPEDFRQKVRKAAEHFRLAQELARERRLQDAILNGLNEGIIAADRAGKCLLFNPRAQKILGAGPCDVEPQTWAQHYGVFAANRVDLLAPGDNPLMRAMLGEDGTEVEAFVQNENVPGSILSMTGTPLGGSNDALGGVAVLRDITEQRELEAQLRQSQKMDAIGRLAGGVAHDFNNLLVVIQSYTALVREALPDGDSKREDLDEVLAASRRAAMLTKQLLAFSRSEVIQPTSLDLNGVVARIEKMLGRIIGEDIELLTELAPTLGVIRADAAQLEQIILNLAINARDAMPGGGRLTIGTQNVTLAPDYATRASIRPGDFVLLAVTDTGSGMNADTQRRIFEPFFTTKEVGKGTGLGLSTVYGIVQQSAGHIRVQSDLGRGTIFKIYFPRLGGAVSEPASQPLSVAARSASGTILLVEDDPAVRQIAVRILRNRGYTVLEARSPGEARTQCIVHGPSVDLLLTDVVMPGCSGPQLARELVQKHPRVQVLFMSGYPGGANVGDGALVPGSHYIEKPFSPAALAEKVSAILSPLN
ncbi:MAG TPA: response regulator [Polyangiaceae bacterium]|jgi:signal transduction histidine kinase/response regulator RpfG family c-di-GMP phosphodiesterase|nr:response regulator [Polyangiaceae bacterium]